ncbi:beta-ketoacyl-ACP synthase 3 [bacterium]|nr:beta-ketoacyl-ACP synthase 3 [bacterium]
MTVYLHAVTMSLPERVQSNEELCEGIEGWTAEKIVAKTGMRCRRIARPDETAADLAVQAAEQLFAETGISRDSIDALVFCTQSPDHFVPATACFIQDRLKLPTTCAAFDFNQGCSGYPYGLMISRGLIESGAAQRVLFLTGETYSKYCNPKELATASLFGDGGAATLLSNDPDNALAMIGDARCGTDGNGAKHLLCAGGGWRHPEPSPEHPRAIYMNGAAIASFAAGTVKAGIDRLLAVARKEWSDIDLFLFHQANPGFIRRLTMALHLPLEKVPIDLDDVGNTGSVTIPQLMRRMCDRGELKAGMKCVIAGFGTGFSWGMTYAEWLRDTTPIGNRE